MDSSAFLHQIGSIALLTPQQEVELALAMRAGADAARRLTDASAQPHELEDLQRLVDAGDAARAHMVQANLRLVVSVARRFTRSSLPLLDLVQDGTVGLIQAVDRFDPDQGCKFSTYAMWWIRQAVTRGVASSGRTVRLPRQVLSRLNHCLGRRRELVARLGREPTTEELADACGLSVAETSSLLAIEAEPVSLNTSGGDDFDDVVDRHAADPVEEAFRRVDADRLQEAMRGLDPLEREVLALRYGFRGEPLGCTAAAAVLGLSRDRVRSLEARGLRALGTTPGLTGATDAPPPVDAAS
jgi:RNA polymerase sigma factor (sigma-70 family)